MGLDLTLCIIREYATSWWLGYNRLSLDRDYDVFEQIQKCHSETEVVPVCNPVPLPANVKFDWYGDEGCKEEKEDPYGYPLTYVFAKELKKVSVMKVNSGSWNRTVWSMIMSLPDQTRIVLWWN